MTDHRASEDCDCQPCRDTKSLARELNAAQSDLAALRSEIQRRTTENKAVTAALFEADKRADVVEAEVQRLEEWKAHQQTGLLSMATQLLDTGFTGTGIVDGIKYLKDRIREREAEVQRLREEKAAEVAACQSQRLEAMEWQSRAEAAEAALQQLQLIVKVYGAAFNDGSSCDEEFAAMLNEANRRLTAIVEAKK